MKQENKELLLKDLCARLPYGVILNVKGQDGPKFYDYHEELYSIFIDNGYLSINDRGAGDEPGISEIKPYLRSMSSMTKEENEEYFSIWTGSIRGDMIAKIDFYIKHHFDFRLTSKGLSMIEAGLALEAPEGMYLNEK